MIGQRLFVVRSLEMFSTISVTSDHYLLSGVICRHNIYDVINQPKPRRSDSSRRRASSAETSSFLTATRDAAVNIHVRLTAASCSAQTCSTFNGKIRNRPVFCPLLLLFGSEPTGSESLTGNQSALWSGLKTSRLGTRSSERLRSFSGFTTAKSEPQTLK